MRRGKKKTEWPEGFEMWIRDRDFRDIEELLLWDCACMCECLAEAEARWIEREGFKLPSDAWEQVLIMADEIAIERMRRPLSMKAIRWGCRLAERLGIRYEAEVQKRLRINEPSFQTIDQIELT